MTRLLKRALPQLIQHFEKHSNAAGLFPILTDAQSDAAWAQFPSRTPKEAAVLIPLLQIQDDVHVLFTKRSANLRLHTSEISFPGGSQEEQDDGCLVTTALRETKEELLHPDNMKWDIVGQCTEVPSITGIPVTAILALHPEPVDDDFDKIFPGDRSEVETVFSLSLQDLLNIETSKHLGRLGHPAPVFDAPTFGEIWGLTAFCLRPVLHKVLKPALLLGDMEEEEESSGVAVTQR